MKNMTIEEVKVVVWGKIIPVAVMAFSILYLKALALLTVAIYSVSLLALYKFIGKWDSPVVKQLWLILKIAMGIFFFILVAIYIHLLIYIASVS